MTIDTAEPEVQPSRRRSHVPWSYKSALVVMAILVGGGLALRVGRQHRTEQMLARHNAVLDVIITNLTTAPTNTIFRTPPPERAELERLLGRSWPDDTARRDAISEFGSTPGVVASGVTLEIGPALDEAAEHVADSDPAADVSRRLVEHYSDGLAGLGLTRIASGGGASSVAVWRSPANELEVWIEAAADASAKSANVRIMLIDSQRLALW